MVRSAPPRGCDKQAVTESFYVPSRLVRMHGARCAVELLLLWHGAEVTVLQAPHF
jgi:hypothetical protein